MKKIAEKGYTLSVTTWENDGDNYATNSHTYETREEAIRHATICRELGQSCNRSSIGVGNMGEWEWEKYQGRIKAYFENNPHLLDPESDAQDTFSNLRECDLFGSSEHCLCRVVEQVKITYLAEDVFAEEISL